MVCVLLSLVLWLSLSLQEQRTVIVEFPVEVGQLPEGQALVELPPSSVSVQLQGTGLDLLALIFDPPTVEVGLDQERVDVDQVLELPRANDATIESVVPSIIEIEMEERVERRLPVQPRLAVQTASSHELIDEPSMSPDSVTISGARSTVQSFSEWPTDSLTLENVRDTVRTTVALKDTLSGLTDRGQETVEVVVRAGKFAVETREVTVEVTGVPAGQDLLALQPSSIRIRYRVLFDQLFESRRSSEYFATVSYDQIRSDTTGYVEPRIHVPTDLVIRDPEPIPPRLRYYTFLSSE
ncbi:MAG: YbbR-like domain-containing protein [Bacteroidetes bacterium QH_7_62_13]|nr:MAG: YbbR-like domain-containing protein [Bacteroidetes bacterium QH_7_62_13]